MTQVVEQPLKWPGGKFYLADEIHRIARKARYLHRVIGCAGGMAELWAWEHEGISELVNDTDMLLTNFWRVLKSEILFPRFERMAAMTPFSRVEFDHAMESQMVYEVHGLRDENDMLWAALDFFVQVRQSRSGDRKGFATTSRSRTRRGMSEQVSGWLSGVEGLADAHQRIIRVLIENMDVLDLFRREQAGYRKLAGTPLKFLYYFDPPYMHEARAVKKLYNHEWSVAKHEEFLGECLTHESDAQIMISGYATPLYDTVLSNWNRETFTLPNNMGGQSTKREMTEVIYYNF